MLLLAAALGAAYFISSRITRPLLVLQEKFGTTRLGKQNERIEWKRHDEIGNLVNQYNIMVAELELSAELLARSERESAWREMAKQVAHEIKNPLTPMKLNVQLLQKAMRENSPQLGELTQKVSRMLMEQIDALTSIASSFSSFARMPQGRKEKVNLSEIISSVINLYSSSSIQIIFNETDKHFALADKEELWRLFGNLIKNAMQSIPEDREGKIEIKITERRNYCIVSVSDNGTGVPGELQSKIFTPNFTTKSGGMGLGLAIVKSIAEGMGGKAWFETEEGKGTTFFVEMPLSQ
jgi:nitrogen fixation/metabolism regulation signal transduction histidine kinase